MSYAMLYWGIYAEIMDMRKDGLCASEIRLGVEEYNTILAVAETYGRNALNGSTVDVTRMYGLPVRQLKLSHAVSVI